MFFLRKTKLKHIRLIYQKSLQGIEEILFLKYKKGVSFLWLKSSNSLEKKLWEINF